MTTAQQPRYIVERPPHSGSYFQNFGWTVRDARPLNPSCVVVMSGSESEARRWARNLNRRAS